MAERSVKVRLDANVDGFKSAMSTAAKSVQDFDKRATGYIENHKASINDVSNAALGLGTGMLAASGLAAKAAIDWESAWAGVTKTVDGTDAELASLEAGLRDMAKELPATHTEIAAVAEAAGQLGIAVPNIEDFTRTMVDLGEATNMTSEEAATSLARFMNIMGTSQTDVDKLGSAVVGLGNNFATTESEIVALSMRLAGAGAQAGLTEGDVMGIATAMSSVGIEAEAGGSAMSLTMKRIGKAVDEGNENLELFAAVAGMTADEFATAWSSSPTEALDAFIAGLSNVESLGMTTNGVLTELGITGIRESDALLRLSAASEQGADGMSLLAGAVQMGNEAYGENIALTEEAANRYETAESRIAMMRNAFVDLGIDLGGAVAPALGDAADMASFLVTKFQELPDVVKSGLGVGTGVVGMALLAAGTLGRTLTAVNDVRLAMDQLGISTGKASGKLKVLGVASGVGLAIATLATIVGGFVGQAAKAEAASKDLADAFDEVTGVANENADFLILQSLNEELDKADWAKLEELGYSYEDFIAAVQAGGDELEAFKAQIHDEWAGARLFSEERDALSHAHAALKATGDGYSQAADEAALLANQQGEVGSSAEETAAQQAELEDALAEVGLAADGAIESLSEYLDLIFQTGLATMDSRTANANYYESIREVDDAVKQINKELGGLGEALNENKTDFDLTTEAGRVANEAFQDVARSGFDVATSMADAGASQEDIQGHLNQTYDDLIAVADEFGITGDAAEALARDVLGIPDGVDIETWMDDEAERQAKATKDAINDIDRSVYIDIVTRYTTRGTRPPVGARGAPVPQLANADGNVYPSVKAFANGSENHVAQIAPAGAWRLWAEPETGGEAYIPLAASKRARSERILADVASRFGMGLQKFDNGGMVMPYEPRRPTQATPAMGATFAPTFNNWNSDAVRATREQVAQFGQVLDAMPVQLTGA